jgi:RNA polymerase sigma-70 factor (ECF subfamily)
MSLSDFDLVILAKAARDSAAFDTLVRRHQAPLRAFLLRLTGNAAGADDIAQETFLKAFRGLNGYRGGASFRSWLFAIAIREASMARRRASAMARAEAAAGDQTDAPAEAEGFLSLDLRAALSSLSHEERAAALLCDAAGFSHAEAATAMAAPLGSVKSWVLRAREKLRAALTAEAVPAAADCA